MNEELIAEKYKLIFGQDTIVTEQTGSILLDRIREMSDTYMELYRTLRQTVAESGRADMTDEDCDKVDMDKYCERQNDCEECEYREACEGEEE